ncbi:hypothetical protein HER12_000680 [Spiroplasma platyhelix PALS-1]|nr:hypothetical protein [Spiroplasma platyhelix PALS-1]UJB29001.1 hypothetical protein SPLAT_v1c02370 [Spiroplasma platyhelix PALS-1]
MDENMQGSSEQDNQDSSEEQCTCHCEQCDCAGCHCQHQ